MFSASSKFLIIILALLQLIAPLVHAHTGEEISIQEIHLPGLEHLSINNGSPEFHALTSLCADECSIISVGTAIKHKKACTNNTTPHYLSTEYVYVQTAIHCSYITSPLHQQTFASTADYTLLPSRAPPCTL